VSLKVSASHRHPDLLLVDLLPAGLEIENQNLEHSIKLDNFEVNGTSLSQWQSSTYIVHEEFRDDRYVAAIDLDYGGTARVFYLVRAVTPGQYRVPAPLVEDMYRPQYHGTGETLDSLSIVDP